MEYMSFMCVRFSGFYALIYMLLVCVWLDMNAISANSMLDPCKEVKWEMYNIFSSSFFFYFLLLLVGRSFVEIIFSKIYIWTMCLVLWLERMVVNWFRCYVASAAWLLLKMWISFWTNSNNQFNPFSMEHKTTYFEFKRKLRIFAQKQISRCALWDAL